MTFVAHIISWLLGRRAYERTVERRLSELQRR